MVEERPQIATDELKQGETQERRRQAEVAEGLEAEERWWRQLERVVE